VTAVAAVVVAPTVDETIMEAEMSEMGIDGRLCCGGTIKLGIGSSGRLWFLVGSFDIFCYQVS
jgi:hypothetical protein